MSKCNLILLRSRYLEFLMEGFGAVVVKAFIIGRWGYIVFFEVVFYTTIKD